MSKLIDLTKCNFGFLTVESRAESKAGQSRWNCRCECGNTCVVLGTNLRRGHTTSCGCKKLNDLSGQHIGFLTVLERSDVRIPRGERTTPTWKCRCDCGAIVYRATDTLTNGDQNMCVECANRYAGEKMREKAGFLGGTQLCKITDMKPSAANTSGVRGVSFDKKRNKWCAIIIFQRKKHHLGLYSDFEDAVKARHSAEEKFFGKFLEETQTSTYRR